MSSTKFVFFLADRKNKMAALASDWLRHFRLFTETDERNSTKLDRKQDLNVLYQVFFFGHISKQKCPSWLIPQKGGILYSGALFVALLASCCCFWFHSEVKFLTRFCRLFGLSHFALFKCNLYRFLCSNVFNLHLFFVISMFISGRMLL